MEYHVENVKAYETGKPDSLIVVIPKTIQRMLGIKKGTYFRVKVDREGRIIYEPIRPGEAAEASE